MPIMMKKHLGTDEYQENRKADPFAFPTETDMRFVLLILIVSGTIFSVTALLSQFFDMGALMSFIIGIMLNAAVFFVAWIAASTYAAKKIQEDGWMPFPPDAGDAHKNDSIARMKTYIQTLVNKLQTQLPVNPTWVWDDASEKRNLPTGLAFGFGKKQYVCVRNGLHHAFLKLPDFETFNVILLHELAHISNRDVSKTVFSLALRRTFLRIVLPIMGLVDVYFFWLVIRSTNDNVWPVFELMIGVNVKMLLAYVLIDSVQRSILRVREVYADARARNWLGRTRPFLQIFSSDASKNEADTRRQNGLTVKDSHLFKRLMGTITPHHPKLQERAVQIADSTALFRPSSELAVFSGLLVGLSINVNGYLVSLLLNGDIAIHRLNALVQNSVGAIETLFFALLYFVMEFLLWSSMVIVFVIFGIFPVANSIGMEIQKAAAVDRVKISATKILSPIKIAKIALMTSLGIVLGGWLAPAPNFLSIQGGAWLIAPAFVATWAIALFVWMQSVKKMSEKIYGSHLSSHPPRRKMLVLSATSIVTLIPLFIAAASFQVVASSLLAFPNEINLDPFLAFLGLVVLMILGFIFHVGMTFVSTFLFNLVGWTNADKCPVCSEPVSIQYLKRLRCDTCQEQLISWLWETESIDLPPVPMPFNGGFPSRIPPPLS